MSDDERNIRDLIDAWITASRARDLPALLGMMTDDVVFVTPGRAPFGKAQFAADSERANGLGVEHGRTCRRSRSSARAPTSGTASRSP